MIRIIQLPKTFKEIDALCHGLKEGTKQIVENVKINGVALDKLK